MATGHPPLYKSTIRRFHGDAIRGYRLELLPESLGNGYVAGYRPPHANDHANVTFTLKQNYFPWNIDLGEKVSFEPLCCGIYVNFLFDRDFWAKQPNKYPPGYYWFSTRIRNHIFIGERITLKLNPNSSWHKSISFFYELSTCDLYIINAIGNSYLKPKDYLSLSFGVKLQIL